MQSINNQSITPPRYRNSGRLREFDAMRGFSMLLVVYAHVLLTSGASECLAGQIFITFRMPLFFLVSGFFAYKAVSLWNKALLKRIFGQKIKAQIICPIVFFALLRYCTNVNPIGWIQKGFGAYWFTIALFQMFSIYALTNVVSRTIRCNVTIPVMIAISLAGLVVLRMGLIDNIQICKVLSSAGVCQYMQFYTMGLIVSSKKELCFRIISNNYVRAILITSFTAVLCIQHSSTVMASDIAAKLVGLAASYIGLILVLALFYSARTFLNNDNRLSRSLCFTGRRTLDIYMIHYFFLPSLPALGIWILPNSMLLFQILVPGTIAVIVTIICLLLSNCIRTSRFLAEWLFGVKAKHDSMHNA